MHQLLYHKAVKPFSGAFVENRGGDHTMPTELCHGMCGVWISLTCKSAEIQVTPIQDTTNKSTFFWDPYGLQGNHQSCPGTILFS